MYVDILMHIQLNINTHICVYPYIHINVCIYEYECFSQFFVCVSAVCVYKCVGVCAKVCAHACVCARVQRYAKVLACITHGYVTILYNTCMCIHK